MQTLADVVAEGRDREGTLFSAVERTADYSYGDFCTNVWKTGNLLRHYGVREGTRVAVVVGPKSPAEDDRPGWLGTSPAPVMAALGAMVDGAVVDLDPPGAVDATVLVAPDDWLDDYALGPGTKPIAYGGPPEDPTVAHLEREAWSENPLAPPAEIGPGDDALSAAGHHSHGDLLAAAREVVADYDLDERDTVALDAPLTHPGVFVAGVVAPMTVGATVALDATDDATVTVGGSDGDEGEGARIDPENVF